MIHDHLEVSHVVQDQSEQASMSANIHIYVNDNVLDHF